MFVIISGLADVLAGNVVIWIATISFIIARVKNQI